MGEHSEQASLANNNSLSPGVGVITKTRSLISRWKKENSGTDEIGVIPQPND